MIGSLPYVVFISLVGFTVSYNVSQIEIDALKELYTATQGSSWAWQYPLSTYGQVWNFSTQPVDPCDNWQGIQCSFSNNNNTGTVTSLNLDKYNLRGTLPSSISNLANLTFVDFDHNLLNGTIPNSVVDIKGLIELRMSYNLLTGTIPLGIFLNTSNIVYLSITENYISGKLPDLMEGHSLKLMQMFFNENNLSGTIPATINRFQNLIVLFLANNQLTGDIPESIYDLVLLNRLAMDSNNFNSGTISNKIGNFKEMRYLYFHSTNLHSTLPYALGQMTKLVYFTFFENYLTGSLPTSLSNMTGLRALSGDTNYLTGPVPACLGLLSVMAQVNLYSNFFTGTMPSSLSNMSQLQILLVQDNMLTGDPSSAFDRSKQLSLESVDLSSNRFSGVLPVSAFGPAMVTFAAFETCFDAAIPEEVCQARQLQYLALDGMTSGCARKLWPSFAHSPKVVSQVAGGIPHCVWQLANLSTLHLSSNSLTGTIPTLSTYPNLTDLDLSFNLLSGTVPTALMGLPSLLNFNLKNNRFCGTITATSSLTYSYHDGVPGVVLSLSSNRFSGIIPIELKAAIDVDVVDGNMFSCTFKHLPPYNDPNGRTYICGSNLLYVSLATLAGVFGALCFIMLIFFRVAYRCVREHDMAEVENPTFWEVFARMRVVYSSLAKIRALHAQMKLNPEGRSVYYKCQAVTMISYKTQVDTLVRVEDARHATTMSLGGILKASLLSCANPEAESACSALHTADLAALESANVPHLVQFLKSLHLLRRISAMVFLAQLVFTVPGYPILKHFRGTYLYQYGWYMSGAFISGYAPAIVLLLIWMITLSIVLYTIVRCIPSRKALLYRVALQARALELLRLWNSLEVCGNKDTTAVRELASAQVPLEMPDDNFNVRNMFPVLPSLPVLKRGMTVNREGADENRNSIQMSSSFSKPQVQISSSPTQALALASPNVLANAGSTNASAIANAGPKASANVSVSAKSSTSGGDSVSTNMSNVVRVREKTWYAYFAQWFKDSVWVSCATVLLNVVVVLSIKGAFVYALNSNETSFALKVGIELCLSAVDLLWGVMFVPFIITRLPKMKPSGKMMLKIGLLYFNSIIAPCLAIACTEPSCFKGIFVKHEAVREFFDFTYCALYNPYDLTQCLGRATWESELDYTPPFIYNYDCYSNVVSAYTPIFIFSYCTLMLMLPLASMYITTLTKRRWYRGVVPGIFWVEHPLSPKQREAQRLARASKDSDVRSVQPTVHPLHQGIRAEKAAEEDKVKVNEDATKSVRSNLFAFGIMTPTFADTSPSPTSTKPARRFRPSSYLFFPGFILASTIHHILVLLTFGLMLPELGFAIVVVVFLTTFIWEMVLGRYLTLSPNCDASKWQEPDEPKFVPECPSLRKNKTDSATEVPSVVSTDAKSEEKDKEPPAEAAAERPENIEGPDCSGGLDKLCIGVCCCPRKCKALIAYGTAVTIAFVVLEMASDVHGVEASIWAPILCVVLPALLILALKGLRVGTVDQAAYERDATQQATTETMMLMRGVMASEDTGNEMSSLATQAGRSNSMYHSEDAV